MVSPGMTIPGLKATEDENVFLRVAALHAWAEMKRGR